MTDDELAPIRARVEGDEDIDLYWDGLSGALEQAQADRAALLAEVIRLRNRLQTISEVSA